MTMCCMFDLQDRPFSTIASGSGNSPLGFKVILVAKTNASPKVHNQGSTTLIGKLWADLWVDICNDCYLHVFNAFIAPQWMLACAQILERQVTQSQFAA